MRGGEGDGGGRGNDIPARLSPTSYQVWSSLKAKKIIRSMMKGGTTRLEDYRYVVAHIACSKQEVESSMALVCGLRKATSEYLARTVPTRG